jgi:hypothetical protein
MQLIFLGASQWNLSLRCCDTLTEFPVSLTPAYDEALWSVVVTQLAAALPS